MKPRRLFSVVFLAGCLCAQQGEKPACDVPLVVMAYSPPARSNEMVKTLGPSDLEMQLGTEWHDVPNAAIDDGPKRVVVIIDDSAPTRADELKMEIELAGSFVEHGRHGDTFALLRMASPGAPGPFEPAKKIQRRLKKLKPSPAAANSGAAYDSLVAAAKLLTPSKFGDTIFLFGRADDSGSAAARDQVRELLLRSGTRFCGLSLAASATREALDLSRESGCVFQFTSLAVLAMPARQTAHGQIPPQMTLRLGELANLLAQIAAPYRVKIPASLIAAPTELKFDVPTADERKIDIRDEYYPHVVYPCSAPLP